MDQNSKGRAIKDFECTINTPYLASGNKISVLIANNRSNLKNFIQKFNFNVQRFPTDEVMSTPNICVSLQILILNSLIIVVSNNYL